MPFAKEHRARQINPDQFDRFRRVKPDGFPVGIESIVGFKTDGGSDTQSVIFDAAEWSPAQAQKWLTDNEFSSASFEEATGDRGDSVVRFDDLESDGVVLRHCRRYDVMPLHKPEITHDGFLRAQGMITKTGIFVYRRQDGSLFKELRLPEHVFHVDALRSFSGMPMTLDHPRENLTPKTVSEHQVGTVSSPVQMNNHVRADLMILREDAIKAVMHEGKNKLSCGYTSLVIDQPGTFTHADGSEERFDALQTEIRGNHVAICDHPRAGPSAEIRVDDAFADFTEQPRRDSMEVEITINGKTYKVSKAIADQMKLDGTLELKKPEKKPEPKDDDATKVALKEAQDERDRLRGEKAALEAKLDTKTKDDDADKAKKDSKAATKARVELCAVAAPILEKKLDELLDMDDLDIMKAVIAKQSPKVKLDGEGPEFIRGVFNTIAATRTDSSEALLKLVNDGKKNADDRRTDGNDDDWAAKADEAREAAIFNASNAWKPQALLDAEERAEKARKRS